MKSLMHAFAAAAVITTAACEQPSTDRPAKEASAQVPNTEWIASMEAAPPPRLARDPAATIQLDEPEAPDGDAAARPSSLPPRVWPTRELSVCWEAVPEAELSKEVVTHAQEVIRGAVTRSWESAADMKFVGWAPCVSGVDLRVRLAARRQEHGPWRIGAELLGVENGLVVQVAPEYLERACVDESGVGPRGDACLELQAVHYFGHALGFSHAKAEREIPGCDEHVWGTQGDIFIGPWEQDAIMNACLFGWQTASSALSAVERQALEYYYRGAGTAALELPRNRELAFVKGDQLWKSRRIGVCWEVGAEDFAGEQALVRSAITDTWQRQSGLVFEGWGACTSQSKGVRIRVADEGPHTKGLGRVLNGVPGGMVLNFTFRQWGGDCTDEEQRQGCIYSIAVHEFGHALGFAHEHNRWDTPRVGPGGCKEQPQGTTGTVMFGAWDLDSVMNYCNPKYNNDGKLSATDIAALQHYYGKPPM